VDEILLRRNEKFDGKVFVISNGKNWSGETRCVLYIPAEMLNIKFTGHEIKYHQLRECYAGDQGIVLYKYIRRVDEKMSELRQQYEELHKKVSDTDLSITNPDVVLENIDKLKELAVAYIEERQRVRELTVDDVKKEAGLV
jgi:hypothetical protein